MKKAVFNFSALTALLVPALAFAQTPSFNYVNSWLSEGEYWLRESITIITILLTVFFLYNVLRFVMNKDPAKSADLRKIMINGLIGLFISVAVWGIIGLASSITGVGGNQQSAQVTCPPGETYVTADHICE
jgi:uncharacterized membrane protein YfcA